jgi:hypothetical protein
VSGLVGSDGLDREWPGQPAGSDQPACRVSSDAERLADEKADRAADDEHDDQEASNWITARNERHHSGP